MAYPFDDPNQLFIDGGVIHINPSKIGGTWAARLIKDGAFEIWNGKH